jgi:hypothetical protein
MTRKNILFVAGCCLFFLAACQSPKDQIARKWQVDSFENPTADSMMKVQEKSIDTMTVVDSSVAMYLGTFNLDSVKMIAKKQMQDFKQQQLEAVRQNSMNFLKDGIVIFEAGNGKADSGKWAMLDKKLVLSPKTPQPGAPSQSDTFSIEKISGSELRLKRQQGENVMFINMKAAGEKKAEEKKTEEKK